MDTNKEQLEMLIRSIEKIGSDIKVVSDSLASLTMRVNNLQRGNFVVNGTAQIGTPANYCKIEEDGTLRFVGAATVWNDLAIAPSSVRLPATSAPTWTAYKGSQVLTFSAASDEVIHFSAQLPYSYQEGQNLEFHIHTAFPNTNTGNVRWVFTYSIASVDSAFPTETSTTVLQAAPGVADVNGITELVATIAGTGLGVSSILLCSLTRTGTHGDDTYGSNVYLTSADFHLPNDTVGGREALSK